MKTTTKIIIGIVVAVFVLAAGFFGAMYVRERMIKKNCQETNTKIEGMLSEDDFSQMNVDEKRKKLDAFLGELERDNAISDIWYDDTAQLYGFTYKGGILGAISLNVHDGSTLGSAGKGVDSRIVAGKDNYYDADASVNSVNSKIGFGSVFDKDNVTVELLCSAEPEIERYLDDIDKCWDMSGVVYEEDYNVTVRKMKHLSRKSSYILVMHGCEYYDKTGIVVYENESVLKYWKDLIRGDVVVSHEPGGARSYIILPSFFEHNYKKNALKGSVMMVESCGFFGCDCRIKDIDSTYSDVFTDYLGADAVIGFKNSVNAKYALDVTKSVFYNMIVKGTSIGLALENAKEIYGDNDDVYQPERDKYFAYPILKGNHDKRLCERIDDLSDVKKLEKKHSTTEETTTEKTEDKTEEKTEPTTMATTEQPATEQDDHTSDKETGDAERDYAEKVYGELIYAYITKRDNGLGDDGRFAGNLTFDYPYGDYTCGSYNIYLMDGGFADAGYTITDLDGDGIYEMIFAKLGSSMVYDVYTLVDGKPKMILASWERNTVYYCGDYFYSTGSNGATYQETSTYVMDGDIVKTESVMTGASDRTGEMEYYYMNYSKHYNDPDSTNKDGYDRFINDCELHKCNVPGLIPFQEYIDNMPKDTAKQDSTAESREVEHWRGIKWTAPEGFSMTVNTPQNHKITTGQQYVYENSDLDMKIAVWITMNSSLPYKSGEEFLEDNFNRSKMGNVVYSDQGSDCCVNSGYLDSGRVYYVKYMALDEGDNPRVVEIYCEYGQEHKSQCDNIVTEFMDSFKKTR